MSAETANEPPVPRLEERVLTELGYANLIDMPIHGSAVTVGSFLDMYSSPEAREHTEEDLEIFLEDPSNLMVRQRIEIYFKSFLKKTEEA